MPRQIFLSLILSIFCFAAPIVNAQQPQPTPAPAPTEAPHGEPEQQEPVKVFTEEVRLPVIAVDQFGHYDPTLVLDDILVLEDGKAQQLRSVRQLPANVLL